MSENIDSYVVQPSSIIYLPGLTGSDFNNGYLPDEDEDSEPENLRESFYTINTGPADIITNLNFGDILYFLEDNVPMEGNLIGIEGKYGVYMGAEVILSLECKMDDYGCTKEVPYNKVFRTKKEIIQYLEKCIEHIKNLQIKK
jgi:hypothetical protein